MALDISAYRKLTKRPPPEDPYDGTLFWARIHPHFPGRGAGLEDDTFYSFTQKFDFAAGSYGGYNQWRDELARLAGYGPVSTAEHSRHAHGACAASGGAFWELINFADNEGVIGPVVAAKLSKDFAEYQERADTIGGWFARRYADWRKAFDMAADGGAVEFH